MVEVGINVYKKNRDGKVIEIRHLPTTLYTDKSGIEAHTVNKSGIGRENKHFIQTFTLRKLEQVENQNRIYHSLACKLEEKEVKMMNALEITIKFS